uniref:Putative secreted protein n=1 Tax=Anopheles darlingi TaxID=43151 RepID=A0A2M4D0Q7_ANODA
MHRQTIKLLLHVQLLLQRFRHLWGRWSGNGQGYLDTVVDEPLQGGERTDHDNTWRQSVPHAHEAQLLGDIDSGRSLSLVQLRHNHISRMGNDGTEHTGNVTGSKRHHQLLTLRALVTWLRYDVLVEQLDRFLEAGELHHRVRDLTAPQGHQTLVESGYTFLTQHFRHRLAHRVSIAWHGLDLHLGSL